MSLHFERFRYVTKYESDMFTPYVWIPRPRDSKTAKNCLSRHITQLNLNRFCKVVFFFNKTIEIVDLTSNMSNIGEVVPGSYNE